MHPKKKEREDGDDAGQREATRIEKNVIEHDVHDYRAEHGQAERDETPNEQKQTAHDLKNGDGVYVAAVDERSDKRASLALRWRHRNEVQKGVGPQDDEDDPEQDSGDDDGVFHRCWCSFSPNKLDLPTTLLAWFGAMRSRYFFHNFSRMAFLATFLCLFSCDTKLFGPDSREIAGGYRLKRVGNSNQFALTIPYQSGGLIIDEIGWRKPFIIARASGSDYWEVINTAHAQRISISDLERKSDSVYQSIPIQPAEIAWTKLDPHKRVW